MRPLILGYDTVSCLGCDFEAQVARAFAGESGLGRLSRFPYPEDFPVQVAGQVPPFDASPYPFLAPRQMAQWRSPIFAHAMLVVHRALQRAGVEIDGALAPRTAVTFSTAIGGLDVVLAADRDMQSAGRLPAPWVNPNSCVNMISGKISILTGATGPVLSPITACATGSTSMALGAQFIELGLVDLAICGAVDFPLVEPIVGGFASMNGAFKTRRGLEDERPDREASRPFSLDRRGFVVSEGAACVVLASPALVARLGLEARLELAGWFMNGDANHFVAPRLETTRACMEGAIAHAGLSPRDIASVNAHATSTKIGDKTEADGLLQTFGGEVPPLTANKSLMGHAMGASSVIETIFAAEGMLRGVVPPTLHREPDPDLGLDSICDEALDLQQEHVLKNAFGFGGTNTCLVLRRLA